MIDWTGPRFSCGDRWAMFWSWNPFILLLNIHELSHLNYLYSAITYDIFFFSSLKFVGFAKFKNSQKIDYIRGVLRYFCEIWFSSYRQQSSLTTKVADLCDCTILTLLAIFAVDDTMVQVSKKMMAAKHQTIYRVLHDFMTHAADWYVIESPPYLI